MPTKNHPPARRARLAAVPIATAALVAAGIFATPAAAIAAVDEHGGASRTGDVDQTRAIRDAIKDGPAKNVILIIGDGMGDSEITAARNYAVGAGGEFAGIDSLPLTGQYTTYSVTEDGQPNYASESASTASAWATGTKTVNGMLSVDRSGAPQNTLLELARAGGKRTGNVSTAEIQDATPASQYSHITARGCYGPVEATADCNSEALENGGLGSISEQLLSVRPDVTLGGGAETFDQVALAGKWQGKTLFEQAEDRGFQVVQDADELAAVETADADSPVLGLFTPGNFPVRYQGPAAVNGGGDLPAQSCAENPERLPAELSLGALTDRAIGLLDNEDGFFLQVEGASIDKQNHAANACAQIGETVDLDEAVQKAMEFASGRDDTLVIVTADHAHTSQIVGSTPPGLSVNLRTTEGQDMIVSYGTAPADGSQQHTGSQVRVAGYGPGAANVIGLTDQTDVFFTSSRTAELNRDIRSLSANATIASDQETVAPGSTFDVRVADLWGDWQATYKSAANAQAQPMSGAAAGALTDPSLEDVRRGDVTFTATAPDAEGPFTVTVTGAQTGKELTLQLNAGTNPAPSEPAPSEPAPSEPPLAGGAGGAGGKPGLPTTGQAIPWLLAFAAALAIAGGWYQSRRSGRLTA